MNDDYVLTAVDKFNYATWRVLDRIQQGLLKSTSGIVTYRQSRNIRDMALELFGFEEAAIASLIQKDVIKEVEEYVVAESGQSGTSEYQVHHLRSFRVTELFEQFYNKYTNLVHLIYRATNDPMFGKASKRQCWVDEAGGIFQFGTIKYVQEGTFRKKIFQALMNLYIQNPDAILISAISTMTGVKDRDRIRREIFAINKQLSRKIGYKFVSSKVGGLYVWKSV